MRATKLFVRGDLRAFVSLSWNNPPLAIRSASTESRERTFYVSPERTFYVYVELHVCTLCAFVHIVGLSSEHGLALNI